MSDNIEIPSAPSAPSVEVPEASSKRIQIDDYYHLGNTRDPEDPEESLRDLVGGRSDASTQTEEEDKSDASTQTEEEDKKEAPENKGGEKGEKGEEGEEGEEGGGATTGATNPQAAEPMEDLVNPAFGNLGIESDGQKNSQ